MYGTVQGFVDYHEERGRAIPALWDDEKIAAALLLASEWLDGTFKSSFTGYKTGGYNQEREWPRYSAFVNVWPFEVFPNNVIPKEVERATYEAAHRELSAPNSLLADFTPNKYDSVSISGAVSVKYAQFYSAYEIQKHFPVISMIMQPLISSHDGNSSPLSSGTVRV